ncbi:MAG: DUF748 domain-containing protein, partial [Desulfobacterales bacterium]|nr:DUF748 domain-containing protein [Desulfobacterales bacterium]
NMPGQKMILSHSSFVWNGKLDYGGESSGSVAADGKFRMNDIQINHGKQNLKLLELKQLTLDGIKMDKLQRFNVSKAQINELNLLKSSESKKTPDEGAALFSLTGADFENIVFSSGNDFGMDSAVLENAVLYLHHTKAGQWIYISDLRSILAADGSSESKPRAQAKSPAKPDAGKKAETDKFGFRIDKLQFVGDSTLRFVDETVDPPYSTKLNFTRAVVSDLDNHRPEQPSPLELKASVGKYSRVNLQGNFQPFRERFSMDVTGNIEALDLPPISPYTVKSLGYDFVSGEMDTDVNLKIVLGKLQGESNFRLNNLKVKTADQKTEAGQDTGLKIPLESTLKLLRDKKNNIQLKVPISGDITDPQFSFRDAINQAVVRALTMASFSYLKYMLGPYGTAIGIAELAIKAIPGIRLQPVVFKPGSSDLNQDAVAYLNKIATILRDRPDLQVSVCGLSTEADRSLLSEKSPKQGAASSSIDAQLLGLAQKRAELIKDHLIALFEIENKRIFICKPELDKNAEAPPRAELLV